MQRLQVVFALKGEAKPTFCPRRLSTRPRLHDAHPEGASEGISVCLPPCSSPTLQQNNNPLYINRTTN